MLNTHENDEVGLATLTLPHSSWLSLCSMTIASCAEDLAEARESLWNPEEREELLDSARQFGLKLLPALLEAGRLSRAGDTELLREIEAGAEELWEALGERPGEELKRLLRFVVLEGTGGFDILRQFLVEMRDIEFCLAVHDVVAPMGGVVAGDNPTPGRTA